VVSVEGVTHALYLLWWVQYKHVPPAAVAAVLAAGEIAITLLEVPTGRFADRVGHRRSLVLGSAIQVAGMLLCWLAEGMSGLVLASLCVALGDVFRSGADQALLYESCAAAGRPDRFQQVEARARSVELIALVAMMFAGGVIVETAGFSAAWALEVALAAAGVGFALAMLSPPPVPIRHAETGPASRPVGRAPVVLLRLIMPAALVGGVAEATAFVAQTTEGATATRLTVLVSAMTLAEAAGASLARYPRASVATQYVLLAGAATCVAVMWTAPALFTTGVVALFLLMGLAGPLRATAIQALVEGRRAEAASWASAVDGFVRTLLLLAAGVFRRRR
jgi:MFS family permease